MIIFYIINNEYVVVVDVVVLCCVVLLQFLLQILVIISIRVLRYYGCREIDLRLGNSCCLQGCYHWMFEFEIVGESFRKLQVSYTYEVGR